MPTVIVTPIPPHKLKGAYDAGKASLQPREQMRLDEDGFPLLNERHGGNKTERIRRAGSEKWVTASGDVIYARVVAGSGQPLNSDPARAQRVKENLHAGQAIRYGTCPLRDSLSIRWVPKAMRSEDPCEPGTYSDRKCCPHVERIMEARLEQRKVRRERQQEKGKGMAQLTREQNVRLTERLLNQLDSRGAPTTVVE